MTEPSTLIRPRRVVDGDGQTLPPETVVVLEGEVIRYVGLESAVGRTPDIVVDFPDHTLLPGFVDLHGYLSVEPDRPDPMRRMFEPDLLARRETALRHMARDLASGVTTLRVMGEGDGLDIALRADVERVAELGPSLVVSGEPIAPDGSHQARPGRSLADPAAIRVAVEAAAKAGVDWVKVVLTGGVNAPGGAGRRALLAPDQLAAAVHAARAAGLPIAVAAHGGPAIADALAHGVDTIEHCALCDEDDTARIVASRRTVPVLTLSRFFSPDGIARSAAGVREILASLERAKASSRALVGRIAATGARFGLGTDNMHGSIAEDARLAVHFGLPVNRVVAALTGGGASVCGREDTIGFVRAGHRADLVAVEGDLLSDIGALARVLAVWHRGHRVRIT